MRGTIKRTLAGTLLGLTLFSAIAPIPIKADSILESYAYQTATKTTKDETKITNTTTSSTIEGAQPTDNTTGSTLDGMTSSEKEAVIAKNAATVDDLKSRLQSVPALSYYTNDRLSAMAWCISNEIVTLKSLGYTLPATCGILTNMKCESHCNPYIIQGQDAGSWDVFTIGSNITLTINGQNPYTLESDGTKADALLSNPARINRDLTGGKTPNAGVGLIQFTDCSTDYTQLKTLNDLQHGFRRSYVINEWKQESFCSDPWTAILKVNQYKYWTQSSYTDNTEIVAITDDEGNTEIKEVVTTAANARLDVATSDKINLASPDVQIAFMDSQDKVNWGLNDAGKETLSAMGLSTDLTYDQYKNITCSASDAAAYWCAYMERPSMSDANRITERANMVTNNQWVKTLIGIAEDAYNGTIDLGTVRDYGLNATSALATSDLGSGSIYSQASRQSHNAALAHSGYLNESQCSDVMVQSEGLLTEELLAVAKREYLKQQEMNALVDWENEVKVNSFENILVNTGRRMVIFLGIMIMIWSIFLYLAYWFDKLNTVCFIDLLGKLSFGHLCISDVDDHATYSNKRDVGQKVKTLTVSHKDILFISSIGFAIATIMATGLLFKWLYWIVIRIYNFLQ